MARGGYRKPANPAATSGPGALSRRTDGGAGNKQGMKEIRTGKYGESKALMEQQQGADMAGNPSPIPTVGMPKASASPVTSLFAPTERPNEAVTSGMPFGAGSSMSPTQPNPNTTSVVAKYLPALEALAVSDDAPDAFRYFVAAVRKNVNLNGGM
jgi:hypothetical protein